MPDEFRDLVARCRRGEQAALEELVERCQRPVFGLCLRMLGNRHDAEDVAQESLVRAVRHLDRWDDTRQFLPWLLAIAGNRCRTWLGSRHRRNVPLVDAESIPARSPDLQTARHLAEEVSLALELVRPEYRRAFLLFHVDELSYAEIAVALECPLGTVKTWVHRARKELAERLRQRGAVQEMPNALR